MLARQRGGRPSARTRGAAHASASAVSVSALFRAGWPGERADAASQKKRVQTALWTLRKQGLDAVLRTVPEGYAIAPDVRIAASAATP